MNVIKSLYRQTGVISDNFLKINNDTKTLVDNILLTFYGSSIKNIILISS